MARILVVEDNADLARGLAENLEVEGYEVSVALDGREGLKRAKEWAADLVILDLMLPEVDGYRVLESLRAEGNDIPVLILTARGEEADKVRGFRSGADDYVTKPFGLLELIGRVGALLRRSGKAESSQGQRERYVFGDIEVLPLVRIVNRSGQPVSLRPREFDLLMALLRRNGNIVSRHELLRQVCGYGPDVVSRTVDTHLGELRRKLEVDASNPRHLLTVRKAGYRISFD